MSDVLGLGVGIAAAGTMGSQFNNAIKGFTDSSMPAAETIHTSGWKCSCGCSDNLGKFCSDCGKPKPELWECTYCGAKDNSGKFCSECGKPKPESWDCPHCGSKGNKGKFCSECGKAKGISITWDCSCGNKNISGKFCSECGKAKEESNE